MRLKRYSKNDVGKFISDESGVFMICYTKELPEESKTFLIERYDVTEIDGLFIIETHNAEQRHRINRHLKHI